MGWDKIHYAKDKMRTLCGRRIGINVRLTREVDRITCEQCGSSRQPVLKDARR